MNTLKNKIRRKNFAKKIFNYFMRGLLIAIPLAATIGILYWLFQKIDSLIPWGDHIPGLGILIIFSIILLIGFLGTSYITSPILEWFDDWLEKTPGIKFLYTSVKDIIEAFVGEKKKFSEPVMVEFHTGIYKVGFITIKDLSQLNVQDMVGVYFPKSYGFMGDLLLVEKSKIKPIQAPSTGVFKMIVSGGVTGLTDENQS